MKFLIFIFSLSTFAISTPNSSSLYGEQQGQMCDPDRAVEAVRLLQEYLACREMPLGSCEGVGQYLLLGSAITGGGIAGALTHFNAENYLARRALTSIDSFQSSLTRQIITEAVERNISDPISTWGPRGNQAVQRYLNQVLTITNEELVDERNSPIPRNPAEARARQMSIAQLQSQADYLAEHARNAPTRMARPIFYCAGNECIDLVNDRHNFESFRTRNGLNSQLTRQQLLRDSVTRQLVSIYEDVPSRMRIIAQNHTTLESIIRSPFRMTQGLYNSPANRIAMDSIEYGVDYRLLDDNPHFTRAQDSLENQRSYVDRASSSSRFRWGRLGLNLARGIGAGIVLEFLVANNHGARLPTDEQNFLPALQNLNSDELIESFVQDQTNCLGIHNLLTGLLSVNIHNIQCRYRPNSVSFRVNHQHHSQWVDRDDFSEKSHEIRINYNPSNLEPTSLTTTSRILGGITEASSTMGTNQLQDLSSHSTDSIIQKISPHVRTLIENCHNPELFGIAGHHATEFNFEYQYDLQTSMTHSAPGGGNRTPANRRGRQSPFGARSNGSQQ